MADGRPELNEDVELDDERRRYVLDTYDQLGHITHYALLGILPNADKKAVKNAYFRLAGLVHPDRYFGKRLGSYKPKLEALFARTTEAFEILSSPERRAAYDAQLTRQGTSQPAAPAPVDPRLVAKRQAALEGLKQHHEAGRAKARQYAETARRARAAGDVVAAAAAYRSALTFAPGDAALVEAYQETLRAEADKLVESHMKKALLEERLGRWAAAAESWQRVVAARPDDANARGRLASALARSRG